MTLSMKRVSAGYTLIELLVVVGITGTLAALLMPAVQMSREAMRKSACASNLRQIGLAIQHYTTQHNSLPISVGFSAHVRLLPSLDQSHVFNACNFSMPPQFMENTTVMRTGLGVMSCPSDPNSSVNATSCSYSYNTGYGYFASSLAQNGPFGVSTLGFPSIPDGTTTTAAVTECPIGAPDTRDPERTIFRTTAMHPDPQDFQAFFEECAVLDTTTAVNSGPRGYSWAIGDPGCTLYDHSMAIGGRSCMDRKSAAPNIMSAGGRHPGGCQVSFLDGHVEFKMRSLALNVWRALGTRNGGEPVNDQ